MGNRIILFGAGQNAYKIINKYDKDRIAYLSDNDIKKVGTRVEGIRIISFREMVSIYSNNYIIVITPESDIIRRLLAGQLENEGIFDYVFWPQDNNKPIVLDVCKDDVSVRNDDQLRGLCNDYEDFDLLEDISPLIDSYKAALELKIESWYYSGRLSESYHYGNLQSFVKYGDISNDVMIYGPQVSHYDCMPSFNASSYNSAVIMSGDYHAKLIHRKYPYVPVFTVGPYLYYTEGIYSKEKTEIVKSKIGKMLLIFLPHTIENVSRNYNRFQFLDDVINQYSDQFDSLWLCVYWTDILDSIVQYAQNKGIHVVSSGYRFDPLFNQRQRSMFDLSDAIVCGDIGTFLSYAILFDKPIARINIPNLKTINYEENLNTVQRSVIVTKDQLCYEKEFRNIFDLTFDNNDKGKMWMNPIAGFSCTRSSRYIKDIFEISRDIWHECGGNMRRYQDAVRFMYYRYMENGDFEKVRVLMDSVGARLD